MPAGQLAGGVGIDTYIFYRRTDQGQGSAVSLRPRDRWRCPSSGGGWYEYPRSRDPFQATRRTLLRAHCPLYVENDSAQREILERVVIRARDREKRAPRGVTSST